MRALAALALVCAPLVAHADDRCNVSYVSAPDGLRQVIDSWIAAEPNCQATIALRVIPTKDGIYLFAERPDGTVHERLVPDLTAAGVLVASWVSDPWQVAPRKKKRRHREIEVRPVAGEAPTQLVAHAPPAAPASKRFVSLGAAFVAGAEGADMGFRLEADVFTYGGWRLGALVQKVEDNVVAFGDYGIYTGQVDDYSIGGYLAYAARWRGWELRGALGLYALGSKLHDGDFADVQVGGMSATSYDIGVSPSYEASAMLSRDLGDRWGIAVTAATNAIVQDLPASAQLMRQASQTIWVASLRRRI